jgi:hypothetical protein
MSVVTSLPYAPEGLMPAHLASIVHVCEQHLASIVPCLTIEHQ